MKARTLLTKIGGFAAGLAYVGFMSFLWFFSTFITILLVLGSLFAWVFVSEWLESRKFKKELHANANR